MAQAMYFGSAKEDTYAQISKYTSGSYYEQMRKSVMKYVDLVLNKRLEEGGDTITIADYGCADGTNSFALLQEVVDLVECKCKGTMNVMIYFNDLPNNDFNLLFLNINESASKMMKSGSTYFAAVGKSMYDQCLPAKSIDIVLSSTAVHFLSKIPCEINDLHYASGSVYEKKMFQEQADRDWRSFLLSRGREMKAGGVMIVLVLVNDREEHGRRLMAGLSDAWREMHAENKITEPEFKRSTIGMYRERTVEDLESAFLDPKICSLGLQLVSLERRKNCMEPLSHLKELNADEHSYVKAFTDFTRPVLTNVIYNGLSDTRSSDDKNQITEVYFSKLSKMMKDDKLRYEYNLFEEVVVTKLLPYGTDVNTQQRA